MTNYQLPITKFMKAEDMVDQLSKLPSGTEVRFDDYDDDEAIQLIKEMISRAETHSEGCDDETIELSSLGFHFSLNVSVLFQFSHSSNI